MVPVYNESHRLAGSLPRFVDFVQQSSVPTELVVVDDGSDDDTTEQAETIVPPHVGRVLRLPHRGKGSAVKAGMLAAHGRRRIFMDVDLATPLEFVAPCLAGIDAGADVVIGSRRVAAALIERHQSPLAKCWGGASRCSRARSAA